jgi:hypothetical protein
VRRSDDPIPGGKSAKRKPMMMRVLLLLLLLLLGAAEVSAHGAVTFPPSRNAIDAAIWPGNGSLPALPMPFEFWCPMPDASAAAGATPRYPPLGGCPAASPPARVAKGGGGVNHPRPTATYLECQAACCAEAGDGSDGCVEWAWDSNLTAAARPPQCPVGTGGCCWLKSAPAIAEPACGGHGEPGCESWSGSSGRGAAQNKWNLSAANGQACFWFNNGCDITCDECDGSTGAQQINLTPKFIANASLPGNWWTGKGIRPDPTVKFPPPHAVCNHTDRKATICDPRLRTANVNAECGSNEDFYYYAPWRAPGAAPVIDSVRSLDSSNCCVRACCLLLAACCFLLAACCLLPRRPFSACAYTRALTRVRRSTLVPAQCGTAGGRIPGQGHGIDGADYHRCDRSMKHALSAVSPLKISW